MKKAMPFFLFSEKNRRRLVFFPGPDALPDRIVTRHQIIRRPAPLIRKRSGTETAKTEAVKSEESERAGKMGTAGEHGENRAVQIVYALL